MHIYLMTILERGRIHRVEMSWPLLRYLSLVDQIISGLLLDI